MDEWMGWDDWRGGHERGGSPRVKATPVFPQSSLSLSLPPHLYHKTTIPTTCTFKHLIPTTLYSLLSTMYTNLPLSWV